MLEISATVTPVPSMPVLRSVPAVEPFAVIGAVWVSCSASGSSSGLAALPQTVEPDTSGTDRGLVFPGVRVRGVTVAVLGPLGASWAPFAAA